MKNTHFFHIIFCFCFLFIGSISLAQETETESDEESFKPVPIPLAKDLSVTPFSDDTWLWTAMKNPDGKPPMINGLLTITDNMVIGVNVPWKAKQADLLAKFCLERIQRRMGKVILTGFYKGRTEAMRKFQDHGVQFDGTLANRSLAQIHQIPGPDQVFTRKRELEIDGRLFQLYNPGPILDQDHVIVYIPHDKVLFLGPLIKAPRAKLPKLSQIKLDNWEKALRKSQILYPDTKHIIAAKGPIRDQQAVAQTYILIRKAGKKVN